MAILKIVKEGSSDLRKKSRPVEKINRRIVTLLDDMYETLKNANGIGLAAPQVGVLRRVVIIEIEDGGLMEMINPEIIYRDGMQEEIEGCLSSTGKFAQTVRPMTVKIAYTNRNGEKIEKEGTELTARAFCHELDHLDGVLFIDRLSRLKRELLKNKLKKLERGGA